MFRLLSIISLAFSLHAAEPLRVCATIPDLGDLVRAVGGEEVAVTVFARGSDDPHFVDPSPGFAKALARADLVVSVGLVLEMSWLSVVVTQSRNPRLAVGRPGWFESSSAIRPLGVVERPVDDGHGHAHGRAGGDVHSAGNPHFLSDPVCGVQVAKALAVRLGQLAPERAAIFLAQQRAFALLVAKRLLGEALVARAGETAVVSALERDDLAGVIGDGADLAGWLGLLKPVQGSPVVADHDLWPYFSRRFGLTVAAFLEPKPGIPASTRHLAKVVELMRARGVRAILTVPYADPRHATFVSQQTGLPVVMLAHQAGSLPDASSWLETVDRNVRVLAQALVTGK